VSEETGQPAAEPSGVEDLAATVAAGILRQEEGTPRDEKGKFTSNKPAEAEPEAEKPAEEVPAEEPTAEVIKFKAKVRFKGEDGSDVEAEVDEDELVKGYMLEKSYRQKTAQLAREREAIQAKIKESVEPKLREYEQKLEIAEQAIFHTLAPEIKSIDWNKLAAENPAEWAQKYQYVQNINAKLAEIQSEKQKISQAREAEQKEAFTKAAREAVEVLQTEIPGWTNELYGKILKAGVEQFGFKVEEVNAITDPRAIKVLNEARLWREFKAAKPSTVDKKVTTVPKVAKPGTAEKPDPTADQWKEGMASLKKSGGHMNQAIGLAKLYLEREQKQ
jgi:hypothetical protein